MPFRESGKNVVGMLINRDSLRDIPLINYAEGFAEVLGEVIDGAYSGPPKVDHSGHLHLLRLFLSAPVYPGPMDLARGSVIE